jgi:1,3-beta-glucan synthase
MAARAARGSQEGYPSSPPSVDAQHLDPFSHGPSSQQHRYYDNESEDYNRRDTYASDGSVGHLNEQSYYDQNASYDPYRTNSKFPAFSPLSHLPHSSTRY